MGAAVIELLSMVYTGLRLAILSPADQTLFSKNFEVDPKDVAVIELFSMVDTGLRLVILNPSDQTLGKEVEV